jgi:hypothetical protein
MGKWPDKKLNPINVVNKGSAAHLEWRAPKEDVDVDKYIIYRSTSYNWEDECSKLDESGEFKNLKTFEVDGSTLELDDDGERPESRYSYYVFAVDNNGDHHLPAFVSGKVKS